MRANRARSVHFLWDKRVSRFVDLTGSSDNGTSGNAGTCRVDEYARNGLGEPTNITHMAISVTGWTIGLVDGLLFSEFFLITSGTSACTGPGAASECPSPVGSIGVIAQCTCSSDIIPGHFSLYRFQRNHLRATVKRHNRLAKSTSQKKKYCFWECARAGCPLPAFGKNREIGTPTVPKVEAFVLLDCMVNPCFWIVRSSCT